MNLDESLEIKKNEKKVLEEEDVKEGAPEVTSKRKKLRVSDIAIVKPLHLEPNSLPFELVLVRHGQSEGNEAHHRSKKGKCCDEWFVLHTTLHFIQHQRCC
jgi:hypothetical protein